MVSEDSCIWGTLDLPRARLKIEVRDYGSDLWLTADCSSTEHVPQPVEDFQRYILGSFNPSWREDVHQDPFLRKLQLPSDGCEPERRQCLCIALAAVVLWAENREPLP